MAQFVVHLRLRPHEYYALTGGERAALISEFNRSNRR